MQLCSFIHADQRPRVLIWTICLALLAGTALIDGDAAAWGQQQHSNQAAPQGLSQTRPRRGNYHSGRPDPQDTVTRHDMVEIQSANDQLNWKPEAGSNSKTLRVLTKDIPFRRGVWYLQFTFKPLRMIDVDMPTADGHPERRLIWYMVYRVTNLGEHLEPDSEGGKNQSVAANQPTNEEIIFNPQFVLESQQYKKAYLDRVLPQAMKAIQKREDPNRVLLNTVQMSRAPHSAFDSRRRSQRVGRGHVGICRSADGFFFDLCEGAHQRLSLRRSAGGLQNRRRPGHRPRVRPKDAEIELLAAGGQVRSDRCRDLFRHSGPG